MEVQLPVKTLSIRDKCNLFYLAASILECVLGLFLGDLFLIILYMGNKPLFFDKEGLN